MGNLQGSEGKKGLGRNKAQGNKVKGKKSPVRELFKNQATRKGKDDAIEVGSCAVDLTTTTAATGNSPLVVTTESWRHVKELQCSRDADGDEFISLPAETSGDVKVPNAESSSEESVFTDPLLTPIYSASDYSDSKPCDSEHPVCSHAAPTETANYQNKDNEAGEVTPKMIESEGDEESTPVVHRRSQTALQLETNNNQGSMMTAPLPSFTVSKHRKVELQPSKCLVSPTTIATATNLNNNNINDGAALTDSKRHFSVSDIPYESNVLRKVASLTLDTHQQKITKPKFVPEKLDFQLYEKFEGQMLMNWLVSSFPDEHHLKQILGIQELRLIAAQFCTNLLTAGVLRQVHDKDAPSGESLFRPDLMYYWSYKEASVPAPSVPTPGRLSLGSWLPTPTSSPLVQQYEQQFNFSNSSIVNDAIRAADDRGERRVIDEKIASTSDDCDIENDSSININNSITELNKELLRLRLHIKHLESEIQKLQQEKECSSMIQSIQSLTDKAMSDFDTLSSTEKIFSDGNKSPNKNNGEMISLSPASPIKISDIQLTTIEDTKDIVDDDSGAKQTTSVSSDNNESIDVNNTILNSKQSKLISNSTETFKTSLNESNQKLLSNEDKTELDISSTEKLINEKNLIPSQPSPVDTSKIDTKPMSPDETITSSSTAVEIDKSSESASSQSTSTPPAPPPMPSDNTESLTSIQPEDVASVVSTTVPEGSVVVPPPPPPPVLPASGIPPPPPPPPPPPIPGVGVPPPPPPPPPGCGGPPPPPPPPMLPGSGGPPPPPPPPMVPGGAGPPPPPPPPIGVGGAPPPPNSSAPIPFPTPPVGGWNAERAMFRKEPLNPPVPMKPLYWTRLTVAAINAVAIPEPTEKPAVSSKDGCAAPLWQELEEAKILDVDEFAQLFSRQVIDRKNTKKSVAVKPVKAQVVKILEGKRSQNVGILSSSLHLEFTEIENAIYNFDTSIVGLESLQQIYEVRATDEEITQIRNHVAKHPDQPLDKPEQFLLELAEIPNFEERVACFMFQTEFSDNIAGIESKLNNLKSICQMLMSSQSLKRVLSIILALGNFMNGGNRQRGQADGFGLEILAKLKDVKSKDNSVTLLHYIVRSYIRQYCTTPPSDSTTADPPDKLLSVTGGVDNIVHQLQSLPVPEPGDIDRAGVVQFDDLEQQLSVLEKELTGCERKMTKVISGSTEDNLQPFKDKMETFLTTAKKQLCEEFENLDDCKKKFVSTLKFYQFQPKGGISLQEVAPKDFFPLWAPFCSDFKDLWKKEQQRMIKEKLKEIQKKQDEKKSELRKGKRDEGGLKSKLLRKRESSSGSSKKT